MDDSALKLVESLGPAGLGVTVILVLWLLILKPLLANMQAAHEKREEKSAAIINKAQEVIEGTIVKNTDVLTRVDIRLRDEDRCRNNDHDDDKN